MLLPKLFIELIFMTIDGRKVRLSALNNVGRDEIDILRCSSVVGEGGKKFGEGNMKWQMKWRKNSPSGCMKQRYLRISRYFGIWGCLLLPTVSEACSPLEAAQLRFEITDK